MNVFSANKVKFSPFKLFGAPHPDVDVLDGFDAKHPLIEKRERDVHHVYRKDDLKQIILAYMHKKPLLLVGPKSAGKTTGVVNFLLALNVPFLTEVCTKGIDRSTLFGRWKINQSGGMEWVDGVVTAAMRQGIPVVLEEMMSAPDEVLVALNLVLEGHPLTLSDKDNEIVYPADGFWIVGSSNGNGTGEGRSLYTTEKRQNIAVMSRFRVLEIDYLEESAEVGVLKAKVPGLKGDEIYQLIARYASDTRKAHKAVDEDGYLSSPLSTREAIDVLLVAQFTNDLRGALDVCYLSKLNSLDRTIAVKLYESFAPSSP